MCVMQISNVNRYLLSIYVESVLKSSNVSTHCGFGVYVLVLGVFILANR